MLEKPDLHDPFAPDLKSTLGVTCLHCGDTYPENKIKWCPERGLWVCVNYPSCDGAGYGVDILSKD